MSVVGYWRKEGFPYLPDPKDYVDANWDETEKRAVLAHLGAGHIQYPHLRGQVCAMCGGSFGTNDMTDGTWSWPEDLTHYIVSHSVRPDQQFVEWVLRRPGGNLGIGE